MNKLGYKQKGMSMLKSSPVKNDDEDSLAYKGISDKIKNDTTSTNLTSNRIASNFDRFTKSKQPKVDNVSTTPSSERTQPAIAPKIKPYVKKGGKATGSMKNYAIGSQGRFNEYAARGWKQDATTVVKGSSKQNATNKGGYNVNTNLTSNNDASNFDRFTGGSFEQRVANVNTSLTSNNDASNFNEFIKNKGQTAAKSMSREEIKNQKDASKKEGKMSKKEIRLQKLNSKAASTKRSTNETIKSIDTSTGTTVKSAKSQEKQSSAKSSRAISINKKARLEKKAGKLKSRIEIQKNNRAKRKENKEIRANR